jgi:hypothetical protein
MRMGLAILGQGKRCESGTTNYFRILAGCIAKERRCGNGHPTFFSLEVLCCFPLSIFDGGWMGGCWLSGSGFARGFIVTGLQNIALCLYDIRVHKKHSMNGLGKRKEDAGLHSSCFFL